MTEHLIVFVVKDIPEVSSWEGHVFPPSVTSHATAGASRGTKHCRPCPRSSVGATAPHLARGHNKSSASEQVSWATEVFVQPQHRFNPGQRSRKARLCTARSCRLNSAPSCAEDFFLAKESHSVQCAILCACLHVDRTVHGVHGATLNTVPPWPALYIGLSKDIITSFMDLVAWKHRIRTWVELRAWALKTQLTKFPFRNTIQMSFLCEVT
jgi:hypothetical protein